MQNCRLRFRQLALFEPSNTEGQHPGTASSMTLISAVC
jgi:hypothetical protein